MAHIVILPQNFAGGSAGTVSLTGVARTSDDRQVEWTASVDMSALAAVQNASIRAAAIAAIEADGGSVGLFDNKAIIGGAVIV